MIEKLLKRLGYEKPKPEKPRPFYYECIGYKGVKKALEIIYGNKEKYRSCTKDVAMQQVIFTQLKEKEKKYLYRYHVIRKKATIIEWCSTNDNPRYCGDKITIK